LGQLKREYRVAQRKPAVRPALNQGCFRRGFPAASGVGDRRTRIGENAVVESASATVELDARRVFRLEPLTRPHGGAGEK